MRFKDLRIGQHFKFKARPDAFPSELWRTEGATQKKISARCYVYTAKGHNDRRGYHTVLDKACVGTTNVSVTPGRQGRADVRSGHGRARSVDRSRGRR